MAMTFTTKPVAAAPTQEEFSFNQIEILDSLESLNQAWTDLVDHQCALEGIQEIMNNVNESVRLIGLHGNDAIPMLNVDCGLEALLQIPEKVITAEKAMEAMDEQKKSLWARFVQWIKDLIAKIKAWLNKRGLFVKAVNASTKKAADEAKSEISAPAEGDANKSTEAEVTAIDGGVLLTVLDGYIKCAQWYLEKEKAVVTSIDRGGDISEIDKFVEMLISTKYNGFAKDGIYVGLGMDQEVAGARALRGILFVSVSHSDKLKPVSGTIKELHYTADLIDAVSKLSAKIGDLIDPNTGIVGAATYVRMDQISNESEKAEQTGNEEDLKKCKNELHLLAKTLRYAQNLSEVGTTLIRLANRSVTAVNEALKAKE